MKRRARNLGITLIQLSAGVAVLSVAFALGLPSWAKAQRTQRETGAQQRVATIAASVNQHFVGTSRYPSFDDLSSSAATAGLERCSANSFSDEHYLYFLFSRGSRSWICFANPREKGDRGFFADASGVLRTAIGPANPTSEAVVR